MTHQGIKLAHEIQSDYGNGLQGSVQRFLQDANRPWHYVAKNA